MKRKQKKPIVKIGVALISVLGMTAIGVTSAFAGANKQYQSISDAVKCEAYSDQSMEQEYYVNTAYISNRKCNLWASKNNGGYYWYNAGPSSASGY
ncbi:hypothetical protein PN488_05765 [Nodularia spumigena CS-591/12]|uniref:hypothetical protein n=1 Tax=Nodularia spumigena TaxID=70799 RepID=UPI00232C6D12|nr:hypothetical protein [Nodularia spumigena]MDB9303883.1 hypothetical protein [Nodularia spumigena CS-591/12]MDB9360619.1 hypothetical protein [Nodularia spumigena CS-588/02]MDB9366372.1 hypothetical protein [Nodularia spumigena CS-588/02A10]